MINVYSVVIKIYIQLLLGGEVDIKDRSCVNFKKKNNNAIEVHDLFFHIVHSDYTSEKSKYLVERTMDFSICGLSISSIAIVGSFSCLTGHDEAYVYRQHHISRVRLCFLLTLLRE